MKSYLKLAVVAIIVIFTSCTDVIDLEVQTAPTRLTIEASLDWEKGTSGNEQTIKLSTSTPYYDNTTVTAVSGAAVKVTNNTDGSEFVFEDMNNGEYTTSSFVPVIGQSYTLQVLYKGETYTATETLMSVVDISELSQSREDGFDDEIMEINIAFMDPESEENYYLIKLKERGDLLVELFDVEDEFANGNEITLFYEKQEDKDTNTKEFETGDIVDVELLGISKAYYDYIGILISQNEPSGPFGTTPVALRGNCVNLTKPDNYAFGYFRLTEVVKKSYTFE
ncbi:DUF4249 domain-containing protein [Arenibacter sp. F20364]|uniref:DUF4249 domain-containing protein n=1 Tax=Arenibacter sp. F20364 TaxID=2926415 RepID=UPI001FF4B449|nr:DUF4249 domain-containing protein [Arenibacter sp. F20364]MCK0192087.1 DUF4249 domain-containing protein [Arenibacter sp. F20364]